MELRHLTLCRRLCALDNAINVRTISGGLYTELKEVVAHEDLHFLVQPVVHDQGMAHPDPRRLHPSTPMSLHYPKKQSQADELRVSGSIVKASNIRVEEVALSELMQKGDMDRQTDRPAGGRLV